jgi:hypothetical protein
MSTESQFPTTPARQALARRFGLPYSDTMQDWEWEVADAERFDEFLAVYDATRLNDAERYSLMEVLVQCVEDLAIAGRAEIAWTAIETRLRSNPLHRPTVEYWSCPGESDLEAMFRISSWMRRLLGHSA